MPLRHAPGRRKLWRSGRAFRRGDRLAAATQRVRAAIWRGLHRRLPDRRRRPHRWAHRHHALVLCGRVEARFPSAQVDADSIFIRDGPLFTSAGVSACIDLALALVEEDHGRDLAVSVARHMVMYLKRPGGQSQYSVPLAAQARRGLRSRVSRRWILDHPEEELSLLALASRAAMSPRNFSRVFRSETGFSPAAYVEQVRMDKARRLLEETLAGARSGGEAERARHSGFGAAHLPAPPRHFAPPVSRPLQARRGRRQLNSGATVAQASCNRCTRQCTCSAMTLGRMVSWRLQQGG